MMLARFTASGPGTMVETAAAETAFPTWPSAGSLGNGNSNPIHKAPRKIETIVFTKMLLSHIGPALGAEFWSSSNLLASKWPKFIQ